MTGAVAPARRRRISAWWWRHQRTLTPLILLAPACLLFAIFVIVPIGMSLSLSLYDWDGVGPKTWVGFGISPSCLAIRCSSPRSRTISSGC